VYFILLKRQVAKMNKKFSPKVKEVITKSRDEAIRLGQDYIGIEHLLLGILQDADSLAVKVLVSLEVDPLEVRQAVERSIQRLPVGKDSLKIGNLPLNKAAEKVLKVIFLEAKTLKSNELCPEHLMLSILKEEANIASRSLKEFDVED